MLFDSNNCSVDFWRLELNLFDVLANGWSGCIKAFHACGSNHLAKNYNFEFRIIIGMNECSE